LVNQGGQRKSHTMVYLTRAETGGFPYLAITVTKVVTTANTLAEIDQIRTTVNDG